MTLHPEGKLLVVNGRPTWLIHGDHLCIDDQPYIEFRNMVRNRTWQQGFLAKPVSERIAMAEKARAVSATENAEKPDDIMDVNIDFTLEQTVRHGAVDLLHGHTHRPGQHPLGQDGTRTVLGDWRNDHAVIASWSNNQALQLLRYDYASTSEEIGTPL
jgi:UDP-2,3-diacylglucosamine hydrolase